MSSAVIDQLNREWEQLSDHPAPWYRQWEQLGDQPAPCYRPLADTADPSPREITAQAKSYVLTAPLVGSPLEEVADAAGGPSTMEAVKTVEALATMTDIGPNAPATQSPTVGGRWVSALPTSTPHCGQAPTLAELLAEARRQQDPVLTALIDAHQRGFHHAGRVILQLLLPAALDLTARYRWLSLDDLLGAVWITLADRRLPIYRQHLVATILLNAKKLCHDQDWDRPAPVDLNDERPPVIGSPIAPQPSADWDEVIDGAILLQQASQLHLASQQSLNVVAAVYLDNQPRRQVAAQAHLSEVALRRRCCDTVKRLRQHRNSLWQMTAPLWPGTIEADPLLSRL
ncbi:MAG: hypothetical protein LBV30_01825 [Propionibacteriaceae bacterium]|jgi:hypothetical protein|nr:hypothetical protein [Propionibacteriaceae bacterium]